MPYQMKNGKWRGKKMIEGIVKTRVFPTKAEAKKWEAEQSIESWTQPQEQTPTVCWLDFCTAYLRMAQERFSKKTWNEKRLACKLSFQTIPPDTSTEMITSRNAMDVLRQVAIKSGNAANKVRKNLAAAWSWGQEFYGLPQNNPWLAVKRFPEERSPRYVPPEEDFWKVYSVASSRDKAFLLFLFHTGARVGELFRLTWEDVDFHGRRVRLGTRKTGGRGMEYAWLPLTHQLHEVLGMLKLESPGTGLVFHNPQNGKQYTMRQKMMERLCERASVKPFGFHAIRHLAATTLAYSGLDLPTVQAMLRHHSPTTTARYIQSLGIQPEKIDAVFSDRKGAKVVPFTPSKTAIGT